jgi:hypothetical protein
MRSDLPTGQENACEEAVSNEIVVYMISVMRGDGRGVVGNLFTSVNVVSCLSHRHHIIFCDARLLGHSS